MLNALLGSLEPHQPSTGERKIITNSFVVARRICQEEKPRDNGDPYEVHPIAIYESMVSKMRRLRIFDALALAVGLNHDSLEILLDHELRSNKVKRKELDELEHSLHRISPTSPLFFSVSVLTHRKHGKRKETDDGYALRMLRCDDFRALWVKPEDWADNLSTMTERPREKQVAKILFVEKYYERFIHRLHAVSKTHVECKRLPKEWLHLSSLLKRHLEQVLRRERMRITRTYGKAVWKK